MSVLLTAVSASYKNVSAIASSVKCLWPGNAQNCNADLLSPSQLRPLADLIQADVKSTVAASECVVAAVYSRKHFKETEHKSLSDVTQLLLPVINVKKTAVYTRVNAE